MEWKQVRRWLLLMLLVVDVFLAGNLIRQVEINRQSERQALLDAVTVAQRRGISLDSAALLDLPVELNGYTAARNDGLEQAAADALLGEGCLPESLGGGISIYQNDRGRLSFRRGGAVELDLLWHGAAPDAEGCYALLSPAGLAGEETLIRQDQGGLTLTQYHQGVPVVNGELTLRLNDGMLQLRGRWLLVQEQMTTAHRSLSRAQLTLALCGLLEAGETPAWVSVSAGYYLQGEAANALTLTPVWVVETDHGRLFLSCITGEQLTF